MENRVITISREYGSGGRIPLIMSKKKANPRQGEYSRRSWQTGHGG